MTLLQFAFPLCHYQHVTHVTHASPNEPDACRSQRGEMAMRLGPLPRSN